LDRNLAQIFSALCGELFAHASIPLATKFSEHQRDIVGIPSRNVAPARQGQIPVIIVSSAESCINFQD
jgi:hypothetical protein